MDAPASLSPRQIACSGCALQPLCESVGPVPPGLPAVDCRRRVARGEPLFVAGARQVAVYAVRAGFVKVAAPVPAAGLHIVRFLLPGDAMGLEGFGSRRHATTATALEDCEICEISMRRAQTLSDSFPHVAAHLRALLGRELARSEARTAALTQLSAAQRLAGFLLELSRRWAERGYSPRSYRLPMERRELADYIGLTIETVSRVLSEFRARGWATVKGRQVTLHDMESLRACPRLP